MTILFAVRSARSAQSAAEAAEAAKNAIGQFDSVLAISRLMTELRFVSDMMTSGNWSVAAVRIGAIRETALQLSKSLSEAESRVAVGSVHLQLVDIDERMQSFAANPKSNRPRASSELARVAREQVDVLGEVLVKVKRLHAASLGVNNGE